MFYKTFGFYKDAKKLGLSSKMDDLPGGEQMLAYYFCHDLRKLVASSISEEAVIAVLEVDDRKAIYNIIGCKIPKLLKTKFYERQEVEGSGSISFADVWSIVRNTLNLDRATEMVTFMDMVQF